MLKERSAVSFDIDGVLVKRPIRAQSVALKPWDYNKPLSPDLKHPIYRADRTPQDHSLSFMEHRELQFITKRSVIPKATEIIESIQADIIIGNTGRSNSQEMVNLTNEQLRDGKIFDKLEYVNFKPDGVSPDESKYWTLMELQEMGYADITHYDDNAMTIRRLTLLLPKMKFVIVQDLTSGILFSRKEMKNFPNVTRIAKLVPFH
jgi:hypothetical protein